METVDRTYQLLGKGLLGPWQVAGVTIVGLIVVTLLLRGDLKGVPQRLRLGLLTARAVIVLLAGWFLFQPSLYVKETLSQPGRLVVVLDDSASMGIQDPAPGLSDLLDRVEIVRGKPLKGRVRSPGAFVSLVERLEPEVSNDAQILDNVLSRIEEELPWRATLRDQLKRMASRWDESAKKIDNHAQTIRSEILSAKVGGSGADDETSQRRSRLMASAQRLSLVGPVFQKLASRLRTLAEERSLDPTAFRETQTLMNEATVGLEEAREQATGIRDIMDRRYFSAALEARRKELKSQARLSRIEIAHRLLRRHVPSLSKKHRLSYQLLSRSAVLNAMPENIRTESDRTEFAGALRNVLNTYSRDVIAGIILVSDGRRSRRSRSEQDTPGDLRPVLESLEGMSVPLHTFLLGSEDDAPDLAVADYEIPSLLRKGGRATITVTIKTAVPEGTACRVTVSRIGVAGDETALAEASFVADGSSERLVLLEVRPEVAGTNPIRIAVSAEETEDRFPTNDSVVESLGVVEGRLRCFVLGDVPDWNMRAAVQALDELPVRMKTFFSGQSDEEPPRGSGNDKVPETAEQWGKYDIAVLGGAVFPGFNAKDASAIVEAAREKGLGLFVLPGPDPDYAGWMAQQLGWPTGMKPLESPSG
ncbi:MAG: hypothetical protein KGZ25_06685, partial [Planctomycetes bacterium]|nr:hypothetical protein [Planctomycetota bacterium]